MQLTCISNHKYLQLNAFNELFSLLCRSVPEKCWENTYAANVSSCLAESICVSARVRRGEGQLLMLCWRFHSGDLVLVTQHDEGHSWGRERLKNTWFVFWKKIQIRGDKSRRLKEATHRVDEIITTKSYIWSPLRQKRGGRRKTQYYLKILHLSRHS